VLGVAFTQVAVLGHDGGHQQVFASRRANDAFGRVVGNLRVGLSYGWWVGKHNRHHANPNKEGHHPDIGDGVLVFTTGQIAARTGWLGRAITRRQAWLFFPLLTLEGFKLHVASALSLRAKAAQQPRAISAVAAGCTVDDEAVTVRANLDSPGRRRGEAAARCPCRAVVRVVREGQRNPLHFERGNSR
jgi:fatty acid desaturase